MPLIFRLPPVTVALAAFLMTPATGLRVNDVAMIAVEGEGAKYWPRWRGPSGQGLAVGSGYVDKWSDTVGVRTPFHLMAIGK